MKQLRTIITMLLVLAMAFSSFGVLAADEQTSATGNVSATTTFSDITPGTKVADAVTKLVGYNVINGYEDGTFKPDNTITRAEFAAVITRFKGIAQNVASDAVTGFSDLDNDSSRAWARPYVKAAADAGIINGFEDGTFRAAEPVTYEQAVKMIICAIGYEPVAISEYNKLAALGSANLTWSAGYIAAANKNGITANAITGNVTAPATRGVVALLTSNAYEAPKLNAITDGSGNVSYEQDSSTVGDDQYNTQTKIEGIVSANYYTSLSDSESGIEANEIKIKNTDDGEVTYEMTNALRNTVNVEELLGKKVTAYYAKDEYALVSITPDTNVTTKIDEHMLNRPLKGDSISYVENGRNKTVGVAGYTFIYNGKSGYINSLAELEPIFRNGSIEVNETTSVVKVTSYEVLVVTNYAKAEGNGKVYIKYRTYDNGSGDVNYYEFPSGGTSSKPEIYVNGTKKDFDSLSLSQYNVINYMESPDVGGVKIRRMYVTTGAKSGRVTSVFDEDRLVELGGEEFYLTNDYNDYTPSGSSDAKAPFEMGDNYTYYLDYTGQIAAINYSAASAGSYELGYVLGADDEQIKIVKKNGDSQIFTMKKSVKVDGVPTDRDAVVTALKSVATTELSVSTQQSGYCQPVKYSLSNGEINLIDTVRTVEEGNGDTFCANELLEESTTLPKPSTSSVTMGGTTYQLPSSTIVMYVPDDRTDEASYSVMQPSKAFAVSGSKKIEIFGADESGLVKTAGMVLVYGIDPTLVLTGTSPYMVVTRKLNGDTIEGYKSGAKEVSTITLSENKFNTDPEKAWIDYDAIEKGDVIRYLESSGEVVAIEMIYDANVSGNSLNTAAPDVNDSGLLLTDEDGTNLYIDYAEAYAKMPEQNTIYITTEFGSGNKQADDKFSAIKVNSSTVYYSYDGNDIVAGDSMSVISDAETDTPSKLIIVRTTSRTEQSNARMIYVLK